MLQGVDALSVKSWTMPFETHVEPGRSILEFDWSGEEQPSINGFCIYLFVWRIFDLGETDSFQMPKRGLYPSTGLTCETRVRVNPPSCTHICSISRIRHWWKEWGIATIQLKDDLSIKMLPYHQLTSIPVHDRDVSDPIHRRFWRSSRSLII